MATDLIEPNAVAEARRTRGLKPGQLAALARISRPTLRAIERGGNTPQADTLWKITKALEQFDSSARKTGAAA